MEKYNLTEDISKLTNIPYRTLLKLVTKQEFAIASVVKDNVLDGNSTMSIDIGYGNLIICVDDDVVKYRFVPSSKLNDKVKAAINNGDSMIYQLEQSVKNKILSQYKEMF